MVKFHEKSTFKCLYTMRRDKQSPLKHFFHETNCKTYYFFSNYYILLPLLLEKKVEVSHTQTSSKNKKNC